MPRVNRCVKVKIGLLIHAPLIHYARSFYTQSMDILPVSPVAPPTPRACPPRHQTLAKHHELMYHTPMMNPPTTSLSTPPAPVPAPLPCRPTQEPHPIPNSPFTPLERDKFFVADSDTNMRQMRQISALQNPSPATALSPFATIFRNSPDTNLPRVRQRFPSWPRYNHETMRQISATKNSPQLRFLSHQLRTLLSPPVFAATKSPGMRPHFRSWLRYNHETGETATPGPRPAFAQKNPSPNIHQRGSSKCHTLPVSDQLGKCHK